MTFWFFAIGDLIIFLGGVFIGMRMGVAHVFGRLYFHNGQCRECAQLVRENGHHPNCQIGRLGL